MIRGHARALFAIAAAAAGASCVPRAPALTGKVVPVRVPVTALAAGHRKIVFDYVYHDPDGKLRGDGAARLASPDSIRLDFFLNEEQVGEAVVIGDSVRRARPELAQQLLPPTPFLWAALGVFRTPASSDTMARVDGDTLRVEIAGHPAWRATFMDNELRRLDLIDGGRIPQSLSRVPGATVRFTDARAHRRLEFTVRATDTLPPFDASIWR